MSRFHLIAPSGYCINQQAALRGLARLTEAGHQVDNSAVIARRCQRFAGTEAERLADVNSLVNLKTPNTIVMAVRGGYHQEQSHGYEDENSWYFPMYGGYKYSRYQSQDIYNQQQVH